MKLDFTGVSPSSSSTIHLLYLHTDVGHSPALSHFHICHSSPVLFSCLSLIQLSKESGSTPEPSGSPAGSNIPGWNVSYIYHYPLLADLQAASFTTPGRLFPTSYPEKLISTCLAKGDYDIDVLNNSIKCSLCAGFLSVLIQESQVSSGCFCLLLGSWFLIFQCFLYFITNSYAFNDH